MALSNKQQIFINEYIQCWNSSEAARRAGYNGQANVIGPRLLANVSISAAIKQRVDELTMSADEALILLSEQARGSHADLTDVQLRDDLKDHPKARLVKTIVTDIYQDSKGKLHHKLKLELYDAQAAIRDILKIHGKFKDSVTNLNFNASDLTDEQLQRIAAGEDPLQVISSDSSGSGT